MSDNFATVEELQARLDFTMTEAERGVAQGALEDLSIDARTYGRPTWQPLTAPALVRSLVLRAAARFMRNYDGYSESRAGDETVGWQETGRQADTAEFHPREIAQLQALKGQTGFGTLGITVWGNQRNVYDEIWVRDDNGRDIPFIHEKESKFYQRMMNRG